MRSTVFKARIPSTLYPILQARTRELGYESMAEYFISLGTYDLMTRKPHLLTGDIARLPRVEQDRIHDEVARSFLAGESMHGSWLEHKLKEAAAGDQEQEHKTLARLKERIGKKKTAPKSAL